MQFTITQTDIDNFKSYLSLGKKNINTIKKYVHDITRLSAYLHSRQEDFCQSSVDAYLQNMKDAGYVTRSINSVIASIKSYCKFAGRTDIYCKSLKIRKKDNQDMQMRLTADEYSALIQTAMENDDFRMVLLIQILGGTQLRVNELNRLTVEAVEEGVVTVQRAGEEYDIYLPEPLTQGLQSFIAYQDLKAGVIFRTASGNVIDRSYIWKQMKVLADQAGVNPDKVYPQNLKRQLARSYFKIDALV